MGKGKTKKYNIYFPKLKFTDLGIIAIIAILVTVYQNMPPYLQIENVNLSTMLSPEIGSTINGEHYHIIQLEVPVKNSGINYSFISTATIIPIGEATTYYSYKVLHTDNVWIPPLSTKTVNVILHFETHGAKYLLNDSTAFFKIKFLDNDSKYVKNSSDEEMEFIYRPRINT